ncbi:very short patch repair endonuclease [Thiobacillus sp.]|uniref:very short patch repair endonuclease n=1 Tax=Thiobacillus sp. TaxID=924 RepID=UPI0035267BE6
MVDIVDSRTRSRMMAGIKGKNTKPELVVRRYLHSKGFRYRLHDSKLPGKPDLVMPKYKLLIFVHGCFWHRHLGCRYATSPEQNREKWEEKFKRNVKRDQQQIKQLIDQGWRVLVIWECALRSPTPDLSWLPKYINSANGLYAEWPHGSS